MQKRFQFSIRSLLLGTAIWAVVLAFCQVAGRDTALGCLARSLVTVGIVWWLCWLPKDLRGRVRILPLVGAAMLGTAVAALVCIYYHAINVEGVRAFEPLKQVSCKSSLVDLWAVLGGAIGAVAGARWSCRSSTRTKPDGDGA
jgi:hypothetical protein